MTTPKLCFFCGVADADKRYGCCAACHNKYKPQNRRCETCGVFYPIGGKCGTRACDPDAFAVYIESCNQLEKREI